MYRLIVPLALTGRSVQGNDAVGEEVAAFAEATVEVVGRRTGSSKDPAALFVDRQASPGVCAAIRFSFHPFPRLVSQLTFGWDGVKDPFHVTGDGVVGPDVPRRRVVGFVHARRDD